MVCIESGHVKANWKGPPTCSEDVTDMEGSSTGTETTVTNTNEATTQTTARWTVTKSSEYAMAQEFSVGIGSEATGQAGASFSMSVTLKDESTNSTEQSSVSTQAINVQYNNPDGIDCKSSLVVRRCHGDSTASVPVAVTGHVWFFYGSAVPDKTKPDSSKHFHWSVNLEKVLSVEERTTSIELLGNVSQKTKGNYKTDCTAKSPGA